MKRVKNLASFVGLTLLSGALVGACGSGEPSPNEASESGRPASPALEETVAASSVIDADPAFDQTSANAKTPIHSVIVQDGKLLATDGAAGDRLGTAVGISGNRVIVGADYDDDAGTDSGAAYIFSNVAGVWVQEAKLVADDAAAGAHFGQAVAIEMDTAVVGAYLDDHQGIAEAGSAYVFVRNPMTNTWTQQAKLVASDASSGDRNGISVAISSNTVITGAYWDDVNASQSGAAYVFVRNGTSWSQEAKLSATDGQASDDFGIRVTIDGDWAAVAAHVDDDNGQDSGSVYAFARNAGFWTPQGKIKPADGQASDQFGVSVSLRGLTLLVGAFGDDDQGTDAGSAYIFKFISGAWVQEAKLYASDAAAGDYFGYSVSLAANKAIIGAYNDDTPAGANAGSVYVFKNDMVAWVQDGNAQAVDAQAGDILGFNVAFDGSATSFVAGAWGDDDKGSNAGAAYVFNFGKPQGASCGADVECASTFCTDGVCCESACGGGDPTDCQVCSVVLGSPANGYCVAAPFTTVCRPPVSACDLAEKCDGMSPTCPINDVWAPPGTLCRASGGACDVAETCTGMSNQCPADVVAPNTKICRYSAGVCDPVEKCNGVSKTCPANQYFSPGTFCRIPNGPCDAPEYCTGTSAYCPANAVKPVGTVCRAAVGTCDALEKCDGVSTACPADTVKPLGTICRSAAGVCDVVEKCDGMMAQCPGDQYVAQGTICRSAAGSCDVVERCTGTSGVCPANQYVALGTVCRAAAGTCDQPETCNGTSGVCPTNLYKAAGTVCRPSMNMTCDPVESCSGMTATCPTNAYAPNGTPCTNGTCNNGACISTLAEDQTTAFIEHGAVTIDDAVVTGDGEKATTPDNGAAINSSGATSSAMCTIRGAIGQSNTKYGASCASLLALVGAAAIRRRRRSA